MSWCCLILVFVVAALALMAYLFLPLLGEVRLNLHIEGVDMANIGSTFTARIAPTTAAGEAAPVSNIGWGASGTGYTFVPAADGMSCVYTAATVSTGNGVTVTAQSAAGVALTDSASLPDVAVTIPEATKLNLVVS